MDEREAVASLTSDLGWQMEQLRPRGIKDRAGNPYNPSYYKRGLEAATRRGGLAVVEHVRRYVYKAPSEGYKKLEEADSLDLACEWLVADETKPYAALFTDEDRAEARARLAPHIAAIEQRKAATQRRIDDASEGLADDEATLRTLAEDSPEPEAAIALNSALLKAAPDDVVALNRLGRAYETIGDDTRAAEAFRRVLEVDAGNTIAQRRLDAMARRAGR